MPGLFHKSFHGRYDLCRGSQSEGADVLLLLGLKLLNAFGEFAAAQNDQPCGQWIQCAGMTQFYLFDLPVVANKKPDVIDYIKGGPCEGFMDEENLSFCEVVGALKIFHKRGLPQDLDEEMSDNGCTSNQGTVERKPD